MKKYFYGMMAFVFVVMSQCVSAAELAVTPVAGLSTQTSANAVLVKVIEFILTILASLAILTIIISGIMYITSGGSESKVDTAKSWLTYSIIGLVVALLAYVIVKVVAGVL